MSSSIKIWILFLAGLTSPLSAHASECRVSVQHLEMSTLTLVQNANAAHATAVECRQENLAAIFSAIVQKLGKIEQLCVEHTRPILAPKLVESVRISLEEIDTIFQKMRFPMAEPCGVILQTLGEEVFEAFTEVSTVSGQSIRTTLMLCSPERPFCNYRSFHGTPASEDSSAPICGESFR